MSSRAVMTVWNRPVTAWATKDKAQNQYAILAAPSLPGGIFTCVSKSQLPMVKKSRQAKAAVARQKARAMQNDSRSFFWSPCPSAKDKNLFEVPVAALFKKINKDVAPMTTW